MDITGLEFLEKLRQEAEIKRLLQMPREDKEGILDKFCGGDRRKMLDHLLEDKDRLQPNFPTGVFMLLADSESAGHAHIISWDEGKRF